MNNVKDIKQAPFVIVPLGGPGVGKSTVCNYLLDGEDSG